MTRNNASPIKVEIYRLANNLKAKLGLRAKTGSPGYLDPEAIKDADRLIEALCAESGQTIAAQLEKISGLWSAMRDMKEGAEREDISRQIFTLAHEIKDIGSMCGYGLIAYFAESLRDYIAQTELNIGAQKVIIQAHIDAMQLVNRKGIRNEAGPEAEELKKMVKIAIDKYM